MKSHTLSNEEAQEILDFLARRMGFEKWEFIAHWHYKNFKQIVFFANGIPIDLYIMKDGQLNDWVFYDDTSCKKIVKLMLENRKDVYCTRCIEIEGKFPAELVKGIAYPWMHVMKDDDCLEGLLVEADLMA